MELANKVGASEIINRIVDDLKDENEQYRKMVMETIEKVSLQSASTSFVFFPFVQGPSNSKYFCVADYGKPWFI